MGIRDQGNAGEGAQSPCCHATQAYGHKLSLGAGVEAIKAGGGARALRGSPPEKKSSSATPRAVHRAVRKDPKVLIKGRISSVANMAHCSLTGQEGDGGCPRWCCRVLGPKHLALHTGQHLESATPCPAQLTELQAKNGEGRGEQRPGGDGLRIGDQVPPIRQVAEVEFHQALANLELSRKERVCVYVCVCVCVCC